MFNSLIHNLFLSQKIQFKTKFSNKELILFNYFANKTKITPKNVFLINNFIFFFIEPVNYYRSKIYQHVLRRELSEKKLVIVSLQSTLIKQIFSFFPDVHIQDIRLKQNPIDNSLTIIICVLSYEERNIAIGNSGYYIMAVNEIFKKYVEYKGQYYTFIPFKIQCDLVNF